MQIKEKVCGNCGYSEKAKISLDSLQEI